MHALYAFCRLTDDLADGTGDRERCRSGLQRWRIQLREALAGATADPILTALADSASRFGIPERHLFTIVDGAESDLDTVRFATFAELEPYCHQVASAVGLACLPIWGVTNPAAEAPATAAGVAFQLTNILRDLGEDLARDRVYLPQDELIRFDCPPERWCEGSESFRRLMDFQVSRARQYYRDAESLPMMIPRESRSVFVLMTSLYKRLLDEIERSGFAVMSRRIRVPRLIKAKLLIQAWFS